MGEPPLLDGVRHPTDETLAAYIDGRLAGPLREELEVHIADCDACLDIVSTAAELADRSEIDPGRPARSLGTRMAWTGLALAAAAAAAFALRISQPSEPDDPLMRQLIAAVAEQPTRPGEGRLAQAFAYAPPPVPTRGATGLGTSPNVRIAAAQIEKRAAADPTNANRASLAIAQLVSGEVEAAITLLESLSVMEPTAAVHSDLAAALLVRAARQDRAEDWPRALAAAERAIKADSRLESAHFNRAIALEGLHLDEAALEAWKSYRAVERSPAWLAEAAEHETRIKERMAAPPVSMADNQSLRERIEDRLLVRWADAVTASDFEAASAALSEAEAESADLISRGGDAMPRDAVMLISSATLSGDRGALGALAAGHAEFGRAREAFLSDRIADASARMAQAASWFERVGSPYAMWAPIVRSIALRLQGRPDEALASLHALRRAGSRYANLRGRLAWTEAIALEGVGRFDVARDRLVEAVGWYADAHEAENLTATRTHLAEAQWFLGERAIAWSTQLAALDGLIRVTPGVRRNAVLFNSARFALEEELPEAALHFQDALVLATERSMMGAPVATAYRQRSRIRARLGDLAGAEEDLQRAAARLPEVMDPGLLERARAEQSAASAEVWASSDPQTAATAATDALNYYRRLPHWDRVSSLLTTRAAARLMAGDAGGAQEDLHSATLAFDHARSVLASFADRLTAFDIQRRAWRRLGALQVSLGGPTPGTLLNVERARAHVLPVHGATAPSDPTAIAAMLPANAAIIYFLALDDRLVTWVLSRAGSTSLETPLGLPALGQLASNIQRAARAGANASEIAVIARGFVDGALHPALRAAAGATELIVVPDGPLGSLPFAALPDLTNRPLALGYVLTLAPSLTWFAQSSLKLVGFSARSAAAFGDGHDTSISGLERLRFADREAQLVASLYTRGAALGGERATRRAFLEANQSVLHFAGHTVLNDRFPMLSRMLLAPSGPRELSGDVTGEDVAATRRTTTFLVVLASCETASGLGTDGGSAVSLAYLFMVAGVPSVVATLWPVDDAPSDVVIGLHREVAGGSEPSRALNAAQVAFLRDRPNSIPVRLWAGFVAVGGISTLSNDRSN